MVGGYHRVEEVLSVGDSWCHRKTGGYEMRVSVMEGCPGKESSLIGHQDTVRNVEARSHD